MHIPYTYLIGWSSLDLWYYGVRTKINCSPDDLWVKYFTSSKRVKELRKIHGEPDVIKIRKTFETSKQALEWEIKVLRRLDVRYSKKWINLTYPNSFGAQEEVWNIGLTKENNEKMADIALKISKKVVGRKSPLKGTSQSEGRKQDNRWKQILSNNPNINFKNYEDFKSKVLKMREETRLGPETLSKIIGVGYQAVKTILKEPANQSWTKIIKRQPDFPFASYADFSEYCYSKINNGSKVNHLVKSLNLSESTIKRAINHWREANSC